jgi:hypothetical protein
MSTASSAEIRAVAVPETNPSVQALRVSLMDAITLHALIFEKLLFQGRDLPLDLAELLEDVGNTYINFSESISRLHLARRSQIEHQANPGIEPARRMG